ncbi:MAG: metallophosphoesterase, partial [Oscillibacter sp.]|nr:metallophosphoesterase [Oscillibacter sp.]
MKIHILHLSDLHWIGSPSGNSLKNAILKLAGERFSKLPAGEKLLVLTGDFHNFSEGYQPVKKFLSELVDKMGLDPRQDVFMVPGNHDIDKDSQEDSSREAYIAMCRANPERLNTEGQKRTDYMNTFLSHYKGYLDFVRELGIYSPEECDRQIPVKVHVRTWRDTLHLLHLNTTLVADGTDKTNQLTDTLSATSDEIKNRLLADGLPNIALGHNNLYDMNETQVRTGLRGAFYFGNVSAYLCGDRHRTDKEYDQRRIKLGTDDNDPEIPNICAPRGSSDERDDFSQFGLILHEWDTDTGKVVWTVQLWDREDPSKLTPGRQFTYSIPPPGAARTPDAPKAAETFRQRADRWNLGDAAEILDARTVKKAADNCVQQDIHAFYRVNDSYGVMLRVLAANKGIPREEAEKKISEMLEQGPVLIAGNGGMGKTTLMLRTAIRWAESGGVAVWLNLPRLERGILDGGKARVLMESLRQWAEEGTRVLLCLNSPAGGETALQTLQNAWMHYGLWTENVHLIMAERSARLKNLPILRTDWLNGANVAELRAAGDTWRPFRLEGYRAEIIEEEDAFRRTLLNKTALSYVESGDLSRGQALIGRLNDILTRYNRPNVNIVELIYRALFDLRGLARRSGIVLDWEEWGRTLRKQYGIPDEDFGLYGGIAAFSLFEYPMPLSLFCRRFKLEPQNLTDLLRTWHISKKSGSIEPVSYTPSSRVASYKGDWGTLEPKHDVVAELFFLFHKEDNPDYNESPIDRLMSDYLVIMTEPEIETLFHKMVNRQAMRQMKQRKLGDINYREYMELVYARMQAHELN